MWKKIARKSIYMGVIVLSLSIAENTFAGGTFGPQSSAANVDWSFDFVETFDNLRPWIGNTDSRGRRFTNLPKHVDGSVSNWEFYVDSYVQSAPGALAIDDFPATKVWRGTKSLRVDIKEGCSDHTQYFSYGTNHLGINWADEGAPKPAETGYDEFYLFYMVKLPKNLIPTSSYDDPSIACDDGRRFKSGRYTEGQSYSNSDGMKFGVFNMGTTSPQTTFGEIKPYSPYHLIGGIRNKTGDYSQVYLTLDATDDTESRCQDLANATRRSTVWGRTKPLTDWMKTDKWFGVEFHFRNVSTADGNFTYMDFWVYDESGNSYQVVENWEKQYFCQPASHKWNEFFFGGNNGFSWVWGVGMESPYFVDDFIINSSRIGLKYFEILRSPQSPSSRIEQIIQ